jgi:hypothetical protein
LPGAGAKREEEVEEEGVAVIINGQVLVFGRCLHPSRFSLESVPTMPTAFHVR